MENLVEKPANYTVVFGEWAPDEKGNTKWPPTTVNNKKKLPQNGVLMQEGEVVINLVEAKAQYDKDENGKITKIQYEERDMAAGER